MTTPTGPRASDPIDGTVRQLLWRLRARLVTPPDEQRAQADLDRMFAAARDLAHSAPSADASAQPPIDGVVSLPDHPVDGRSPQDAAVASEASPAAITHIADPESARTRRRWAPGVALGRVAAAVIVLTVATGVAGARDGAVTLQALLGRGEAPVVTDEPVNDDPTGDLALGDDPAVEPDEPEAGPDDDLPAPPVEDRPAIDLDPSDTDDPGPTDDGSDDGSPEEPTSGSDGRASSGAGSDGSRSGGDRVVEDTPTVEDPPAADDEIVAAPAPERTADDDLAGFGGPRPCDEATLADCLPPPNDDEPVSDDGADGVVAEKPTTDDTSTKTDELASRRFGGSSMGSDEPADDL